MEFYEEFNLNEKNGLSFEENLFHIINKNYISVLEKTPNWIYICDFINEEVLKEFIGETICECVFNKNYSKNNINFVISKIFEKIQYAGLPYKWENYYLEK